MTLFNIDFQFRNRWEIFNMRMLKILSLLMGVKKDSKRALKLFRKAADQGVHSCLTFPTHQVRCGIQ